MWQYNIKSQVFEKTEHSEQCTMFFVCEDFGECGHTAYESAGLVTGETKEEVNEILALMLLDCSDDPHALLDKMRAKYTKRDDETEPEENLKVEEIE